MATVSVECNVTPFGVSPCKGGEAVGRKGRSCRPVNQPLEFCPVGNRPGCGKGTNFSCNEDKLEDIIIRDRGQVAKGGGEAVLIREEV